MSTNCWYTKSVSKQWYFSVTLECCPDSEGLHKRKWQFSCLIEMYVLPLWRKHSTPFQGPWNESPLFLLQSPGPEHLGPCARLPPTLHSLTTPSSAKMFPTKWKEVIYCGLFFLYQTEPKNKINNKRAVGSLICHILHRKDRKAISNGIAESRYHSRYLPI